MSLHIYFNLLVEVMLPMALLVMAGAWWRRSLGESGVRAVRSYISTITIHLFAPALMFAAAASAPINRELLSVPILMASGILIAFFLLYVLLHHTPIGHGLAAPTRAALMLCGIFGNVLFMGYPLLHFLYGERGAQYAVFADMAASTPLLWSLGVAVATRIGQCEREPGHPVVNWLKLPPIWAFLSGLAFNFSHLNITPLLHAARFIGQPTIPVMLLMLGISVPWHKLTPNRPILVIITFKLLLLPLLITSIVFAVWGKPHPAQVAAIIESGVPTMLMALGLADRYKLDVETTALTIAWTSILMIFTLPLWLLTLL